MDPDSLIVGLSKMQDKLGLAHVSLSGGEPLLYPDLHRLLMALTRRNLQVTVTTNGNNSEALTTLIKSIPASYLPLISIRVSLDGGPAQHNRLRGHGTYVKAFSSAAIVSRLCGGVSLNTVVSPETLHGFHELLQDVQGLSIDHWALITEVLSNKRRDIGFSHRDICNAAAAIKRLCCRSGFASVVDIWNYLDSTHNYVLIECNGRLILPSRRENDAIFLGWIADFDHDCISRRIADIERRNTATYFSWHPDS